MRRKRRSRLTIILSIILVIAIGILIVVGLKCNDKKKNSDIDTDELVGYTVEQQIQDEEAVVIETKYGNLYFPRKWEENLHTEIVDDDEYKVEFYGIVEGKGEQHIFEIVFGEVEGMLLGNKETEDGNMDVYLVTKDFEFTDEWTDEDITLVCSMQEDMNYLIGMLEKEDGFTSAR